MAGTFKLQGNLLRSAFDKLSALALELAKSEAGEEPAKANKQELVDFF